MRHYGSRGAIFSAGTLHFPDFDLRLKSKNSASRVTDKSPYVFELLDPKSHETIGEFTYRLNPEISCVEFHVRSRKYYAQLFFDTGIYDRPSSSVPYDPTMREDEIMIWNEETAGLGHPSLLRGGSQGQTQ